MFLAFSLPVLVNIAHFTPFITLIAGMAILLIAGLLDDLLDVRALYRLLIQIAVATLMVYAGGLEINHLGKLFGEAYGNVGLGPFSFPFTVACMVFLINSINMSDGLDGLAGGTGLYILMMLALVAWLAGAPAGLIIVCLVLAMAVLGFLIYNMQSPFRNKASAFMGDAGSMMLGFAVAWLALAIATAEKSSVYPITIAWILLIPSMDALAVIVRRISLGRSPMSADRSHMHHIIFRCGFSVRNTVRVVHLLVLGAGAMGVAAWYYGLPEWLLFFVATGLILGYMFLLTMAHRILRRFLRRNRLSEASEQINDSGNELDTMNPASNET